MNTSACILKLAQSTPKYLRSPDNDRRVAYGDDADLDAWEPLGGGIERFAAGFDPNITA